MTPVYYEVPLFHEVWFRFLLGFLIGGAFGSFITMLSYRLPRKMNIILPPSRCPHCHHKLALRDLVPIASYLLMRGKCRFCGTEVGTRYVLIELITGLSCAIAYAVLDFQPATFAVLIAIVAVITLVTIKIEKS